MTHTNHTIFQYYSFKFLGFLTSLFIFSLIFYYLVWRHVGLWDIYYVGLILIVFLFYVYKTMSKKDYRSMMHVKGLKKYYFNGFKDFGHIITNVVNFILLALVYFIAIAVVAIFSKLTGKRFIDIEKHDRPSHWKNYNLSTQPLKEYFRQF